MVITKSPNLSNKHNSNSLDIWLLLRWFCNYQDCYCVTCVQY